MRERRTKYKPYREWYFEGYSRQNYTDVHTGKKQDKLVYTGEYYKYNTKNIVLFKLMVFLLLILSILSAIGAIVIECNFNRQWTGFTTLVLVFPILFLLIPSGHLLMQKLPLTVRQIHAGYFEMSKWITWGLSLIICVLICDFVYILTNKDTIDWMTEIWHPLLICVNIVVNRVWSIILKKNYPIVDYR